MVLIKRYLDIGAQTLLLPFVQNAGGGEARGRVRRAIRRRACAASPARGRASRYGRVKDYLKNASSEICVLVQVETREALKQIEAIASVDGVDGVFIGPNDLSASFGHIGNWGHPEVQAAFEDAGAAHQEDRQGGRHPHAQRGGGEEVHRLGLHLHRGRRRSRPAREERRRAGEAVQERVIRAP